MKLFQISSIKCGLFKAIFHDVKGKFTNAINLEYDSWIKQKGQFHLAACINDMSDMIFVVSM